jgi:repressor LexA
MANSLTPKQEQLYLFLRDYITQHRHAPYLREIQQAFNIKSHKQVIDRLVSLERKGYIRRKINQHQGIKLVSKHEPAEGMAGSINYGAL